MPITPKLVANSSVIVVDVEAGEGEGSTALEYWKEAEDALWHRWRPGAWQRVAIPITDLDAPELTHGYFNSPSLRPGWVYEVTIWQRGVDPNRIPSVDRPPRALASLTVFALRKRPEVRSFLSDETERAGGTYRQHYLVTKSPVVAFAAVGIQPPVSDDTGFITLPDIVQEVAVANLSESFDLLLSNLYPGTYYHELVRLSDEYGNWEYLHRTFTTLRRRVEVRLTGIDIQGDSDDLSNGEATFLFELQSGKLDDPKSWITRDKTSYANSNIESGKAVAPVPNGVTIIPAEPVTALQGQVRFRVSAEEDDQDGFSIIDNDTAWGMKDLYLPVGPDEKVVDRADAVKGGPGDNGFEFTVSFLYSVEYV